ncbi:hypothetical protein GDO81_007974 [Engystomops pustulosus]|uniref:Uncharacterized protein n=1 Tax=Engystomops pustulosus TaxID=76066 RepID=A0AAV7CC65_ENGPU|nr:hypothetical protein GDO81_007974 [Engystomops pustulosus]
MQEHNPAEMWCQRLLIEVHFLHCAAPSFNSGLRMSGHGSHILTYIYHNVHLKKMCLELRHFHKTSKLYFHSSLKSCEDVLVTLTIPIHFDPAHSYSEYITN